MVNLRKGHIKRLFGRAKDKPDEKVDDIWIDMFRSEEFPSSWRSGGVDFKTRISWDDGPGGSNNADNRTTRTLKITDPQNPPDNPDDPDEYIPVEVITGIRIKESGQEVNYRFKNDPDDPDPEASSRKVNNKRVVNAEINADAESALNNDDIVDIQNYQRNENSGDSSDYVDQEVIKSRKATRGGHAGDASRTLAGSGHQEVRDYQNAAIFDSDGDFAQDDTPAQNDYGTTPKPVRLDPLQSIVNVRFAPTVMVILVSQDTFSYELDERKAEFLDSFVGQEQVATPNDDGTGSSFDFPGRTYTAFKASSAAGDWITINVDRLLKTDTEGTQIPNPDPGDDPDNPPPPILVTVTHDFFEGEIFCYVFPWTKDTTPSIYFDAIDRALISGDGDPKNILDSLFIARVFTAGTSLVWKLRYAKHRFDSSSQPPNRMIQCYPTSGQTSWEDVSTNDNPLSSESTTTTDWISFGYQILTYRLDRKGTGDIFDGKRDAWDVAQIFRVDGSDGSFEQDTGILFGDPPLIAADVAYSP